MVDYSNMPIRQLRPLVRKNGWNGQSVDSASVDELRHFMITREKPESVNRSLPATAATEPHNNLSERKRIFRKIADAIGTCSIFQRKSDNKPAKVKLTWGMFQHDSRTDKDGKLFAPAIFSGTRSGKNFISASGICLDFDHGEPSIKDVLEIFAGTLAAYYSTFSHSWKSKERKEDGVTIPADSTYTPENPRFRVIIPLSRPVNAEEHGRLVLGVKSIIPHVLMECLDETCFQKERAHYLPACLPDHKKHAFIECQDGEPLDVEFFLSLAASLPAVSRGKRDRPAVAEQTDDTLKYEFTDKVTGEVYDLVKWAAQNQTFDIVSAVDRQYFRGKLKDGKQHIQCPFEDQHTDQGQDLATFIVNASPPNYPSWTVHCMHTHCVGRDRLDLLLVMLEKGWISPDIFRAAAPLKQKRPQKVYFPVDEISASLEWSTLEADEFRIALHVSTLMWSDEDGTIPDNDRLLAKRLRISLEKWGEYRESLSLTGWLVECGGRLINSIVKREFDKAQTALMRATVSGQKGGRIAQQQKQASSTPFSTP